MGGAIFFCIIYHTIILELDSLYFQKAQIPRQEFPGITCPCGGLYSLQWRPLLDGVVVVSRSEEPRVTESRRQQSEV